jgi:hypothetical protein
MALLPTAVGPAITTALIAMPPLIQLIRIKCTPVMEIVVQNQLQNIWNNLPFI